MIELLQRFVACVRPSGLRVSTPEMLDCLKHLQIIDLLDEDQFKTALRTNFAKSRRDQAKFDILYNLFFHELRTDIGTAQAESLKNVINEVLDKLNHNNPDDSSYKTIIDFISGDPVSFLEQVQNIQSEDQSQTRGLGSNLGVLAKRLNMMLKLNSLEESILKYLNNDSSNISWENRRDLKSHFKKRLDMGRKYLIEDFKPYEDATEQILSYEKRLSNLGERSFSSLAPKEIEEMREVIAQFVKKLKDTIGLRYSRNTKGILDVKKTLRKSAKYQGVPIEIIYKKKPPKKGKIVTICDVSGSVWSAARFMLNMLYALQEYFTKVRSFVFVSDMDEVTQIFESNEINIAIDKALKEAKIAYGSDTDYGKAFRNFKKSYMDSLNKKTTLIIIGDGRSNYSNPEEGILDEMRDKCRRLIWLNPESKQFWYTGDSEMQTYEIFCHQVRQCRNLNQLLDFINDLIL